MGMPHSTRFQNLGLVVLLGSAWGLSEALLGLGLKSCARLVSGSVMTAVALFFLAAGLAASRRIEAAGLLVVMAVLFKMFDAALLSLPVRSGAVANPIFAFVTEALALVVLASAIPAWKNTTKGRIPLGGASGLTSAAVFPLVGLVTGVPACLLPGTGLPLAWAFSPIAAGLAAATVPLGFWAGQKLSQQNLRPAILSAASILISLALITLIRLA
jgi:hypothetical protein